MELAIADPGTGPPIPVKISQKIKMATPMRCKFRESFPPPPDKFLDSLLIGQSWLAREQCKNEEEHLQHLEIIFERLREAGLKLKRSKCSFMKMHTEYLGHIISEKGIEPMLVLLNWNPNF